MFKNLYESTIYFFCRNRFLIGSSKLIFLFCIGLLFFSSCKKEVAKEKRDLSVVPDGDYKEVEINYAEAVADTTLFDSVQISDAKLKKEVGKKLAPKKKYVVYAGSFVNQSIAKKQVQLVKKKGFRRAKIVKTNKYYKVIVDQFSNENKAKDCLDKLLYKYGIDAIYRVEKK